MLEDEAPAREEGRVPPSDGAGGGGEAGSEQQPWAGERQAVRVTEGETGPERRLGRQAGARHTEPSRELELYPETLGSQREPVKGLEQGQACVSDHSFW